MDSNFGESFRFAPKDYGEKKYEEGLDRLKSKYSTLFSTSSSTGVPPQSDNRNISNKRSSSSHLNLYSKKEKATTVREPSMSSFLPGVGIKGIAPSSKPIDLSSSKLALLDEPAGSVAPTPRIGKRKVKAIKKRIRESSKGPKWFDMKAPEMTDDRKNDLEALTLRSALDTKRFYKRNSVPIKPKYFHVAKIVESSADFYNSRVPKKQRKRTIAEELMAEMNN